MSKFMSDLESRIKVLEELVAGLHNITIPPPKLEKKIIDLSTMVGSDILVEFKDSTQEYQEIGFLNCIGGQTLRNYYYEDKHLERWLCCRILEDHWHSFRGDKCPLPEGLIATFRYINDDGCIEEARISQYRKMNWAVVIAFKVLGTADDARHEWQEEKEE